MQRVLIVCTTDSMIWNFLVPHIEAMMAKGISVECACSKTGFYFDDLKNKYQLRVFRIPFERSPFSIKNMAALKKLYSIMKKGHYDIVFCHEPVGGALGRVCGWMNGCYVIYMAHGFHFYKNGPIFKNHLFYISERILAKITDVIITINTEDFIAAKRFKLRKNGRVFKIDGIGVNTRRFLDKSSNRVEIKKSLGLPIDSFVVTTVSEFIPRKNISTGLKAFSKAKLPNSYYLLVGGGQLEKELKKQSKDLGIDDRTLFLPFRKDIESIYRITDIFLFPTFQEGLPLVGIEAMCSGLPLVCSNVRGVNEYANENTGITCNPFDYKEFAAALCKLYYNENMRKMIGENNTKLVDKFDIEHAVSSILHIFEYVQLLDMKDDFEVK